MFCPQCGSPIADNSAFCPICGNPLGTHPNAAPAPQQTPTPDQTAPQPAVAPAQPMAPYPAAPQQPIPATGPAPAPARKRSRGPLIAAIAVILVLIFGCGGLALHFLHKGASPAQGSGSAALSADSAASDNTASTPTAPARQLSISVQQVDSSAFPHVKVYLKVEDSSSGEVPAGLKQSLFTLERQDANAAYVKQKVTQVTQLNDKEALKVDLVADVSGSMNGQPIRDAQSVMNDFIDSMQFSAGDEAELTSFSTGVRLEQEFTKDASSLHSAVNGLSTSAQTSLYDALYTAVERVAAQSGARCVIAFTDGQDNRSSVTLEEVEEFAMRYRVPIFIIGVGDIDYSSLSALATQTGGSYYNVSQITSMSGIYDEIYRAEKDLYLLEYDDTSGASVSDASQIRIGYAGTDYAGTCDYSYTPYVLNNVESKGLYKSGPEATVEGYLKNWAPAISNKDYSKIRPYILDGSNLHTMQKKYVQNGFAEKLDSYEITSTKYTDDDHATIRTRETFYVQYPDKPLQLLTQTVTYTLERVGGQWYMTDLSDLKVPIRINQ